MPHSITIRQKKGKPGQVYYPLQLNVVRKPSPGAHEVLIKLEAAALNHRDVFIRQHMYPDISFRTPLLSDGCGVVVEAGPECGAAAVAMAASGQRVLLTPVRGWASDSDGPEKWAHGFGGIGGTEPPHHGLGAAQNFIVVREDEVEPCPEHLSALEGAAIPSCGLTAWRALVMKSRNALPGRNILVTGIGGGVALQALQLAVAMGCSVFVTSNARVQGAWNLHDLLPKDLDFFIALSSFLGDAGNPDQAIYAGTAVFYDAFAKFRNSVGQHTVSIALPVVLDVGYVSQNYLAHLLKLTLGATLTMADIRTIVKGIVMGDSSLFHRNGKAACFKLYLGGQAVRSGSWKYLHPVLTKYRLEADCQNRQGGGVDVGADLNSASWTAAEDPLVGLTEALITKVSAMTMIVREEVGADTPLASFSLDSLVSVELRNWIRRETSVELALSAITQAECLRALAAAILRQLETIQGA